LTTVLIAAQLLPPLLEISAVHWSLPSSCEAAMLVEIETPV